MNKQNVTSEMFANFTYRTPVMRFTIQLEKVLYQYLQIPSYINKIHK